MTGDSVSIEEKESSDVMSTDSETIEELTISGKLFGVLFLGLFLSTAIMFSLLGLIALIQNVLVPLEHWSEEFELIIFLLYEIPILTIITLVILATTLIVGFVNRGGVEGIWNISLPKNRKWVVLQGFIVLILGTILIASLIILQLWLESSLESWSEQMPGSSGDFIVGMITSPIYFSMFILTGILGYLIAVKLPIFRNKHKNEI